MARKLTRAERYKRNYRLIQNTYHNSVLSKRAQTWSDERIFEELGVQVTKKRTPTLKKITTKRQRKYYDRKFNNFQYGKEQGLTPDEALKYARYVRPKINQSAAYQFERKRAAKELTKKQELNAIQSRMDLWSAWSRHTDPFPPDIEDMARKENRATKVAGKQLDDYAHYGYVVAYYMFVENRSRDEIKELIAPDPHDSYRVIYRTEVRAV